MSSVRGRGPELGRLAAWSTVQALPAFLSGRLVAQAIDQGFLAHRTATGFAWLGVFAASVLVGAWGTRQTFLRLAVIVEPFRDELARLAVTAALRRSTVPGASADTAGVARLSQHVEIAREAYGSLLLIVQISLVTTVSALLGLLTLAPAFLVLVLPPVVVGVGLFLTALPPMAARQRVSILADERIAETGSALAGGLRDVVACGAEERVAATVGREIDAKARATREVARFTALRTVSVAIGGLLPIVLILAAGPWLLRHGATTGTILGALTYVVQGVQPALRNLVGGLGSMGLWLVVALRRIVEATGLPGELRATDGRDMPRPGGHELVVKDVTFGYGRSPVPVIDGLELVVPEGDHLAVVGPSGVGKSTLAGLIAGLLEPQAGEVRIGGVPVGDIDAPTAARHRVLIPQEAYVFEGTLWENLTYLRDDAARAEVDRAVEELGIRPLVERVGGYWADLHPAELSAGERQLITLVRAYVSPARLAVLDEATCHLDPASEAQAEEAFRRRPGSLIVIAHRISSALRARRILVLDGTRQLIGSHEELLAQSELYRDLVGRWEDGATFPRSGPPQPAGDDGFVVR
jgi:ABC-type multidrug transport system fused ATPase/permease subunit